MLAWSSWKSPNKLIFRISTPFPSSSVEPSGPGVVVRFASVNEASRQTNSTNNIIIAVGFSVAFPKDINDKLFIY